MFFRRFDSILTECLELMQHGATVDHCVARYPRHAAKLRPMLTLAKKVSKTPLVPARPQAAEHAWTQLQKRTAELRAGGRPVAVHVHRMSYGWLKPAAFAASFVMALSVAGGGVVFASQDALPNSPLYTVKLTSEDVRLWFVFDEGHEANILLDQSDQRIDEIMTMVRQGHAVPQNALSDMNDRNQRAVAILEKQPENTSLHTRVIIQAQEQEDLLLALWPEVRADALPKYTEAVAYLHNTRLGGGTSAAAVSAIQPEELAGGILTISGLAEATGEANLWRVGGVEVRIDDKTIGNADWLGGSARVLVAKSSNGRLHALNVANLQTGPADSNAVVSGVVESVTDEGMTVAGQFIPFSDSTLRIDVKPGERVQITLADTPEGGVVADVVKPFVSSAATAGQAQTLWFEGTIQGDVTRSTSQWTVSGYAFEISDSTSFDARGGSAADGARVQIEAVGVDGDLQARRVTVLSSQDSADAISIVGTFDGFDEASGVWRISGVAIVPPESANDSTDPPVGSLVVAETRRDGTDLVSGPLTIIEQPDQPALVQLQGTISAIDGSRWTLEIGDVKVASTARVSGRPDVGVRAFIWGQRGTDGTLQATYARVLDDAPILSLVGAEPTPTDIPFDVSGGGP